MISVKKEEPVSTPKKRGRKPKNLREKRVSEDYDPFKEKEEELAKKVIVEIPKDKPSKKVKKHRDVAKEEEKIVKELKEIQLTKRLNPEEDDALQEKEELVRDEEDEFLKAEQDFLMSQGKKKKKRQKVEDEL